MGLRYGFRIGRNHSTRKADSRKVAGPEERDISQSQITSQKPSEEILSSQHMQRQVEPLGNIGDGNPNVAYGCATPQTGSTSSSRTSIFDSSSKLRRLIRGDVFRKRNRSDVRSRSEREVPESDTLSDAEFRHLEQDLVVENRDVLHSLDPVFPVWEKPSNEVAVGMRAEMGRDIESGVKVSDGYVGFIVPNGWVASLKEECFYLFNGLSFGYIRSVAPIEAASALLETGRLQIVSRVSAVSSPTFVDKRSGTSDSEDQGVGPPYMQIDYTSDIGGGKGIAVFKHGFESGACVFALCGPREDMTMIIKSMQDLAKSVHLISVRKKSRITMQDLPTYDGISGGMALDKDETMTDSACVLQ